MALTTKSASGWVATCTLPAEPWTISIPLTPAFVRRVSRTSASAGAAIEIRRGFQRRACSKTASTFLPAASDTTSKRSGWDSTTLSVLWPMEPVEPRMAMCFMRDGRWSFAVLSSVVGQYVELGPTTDGQRRTTAGLSLHDAPSRIVPQHWSGKEQGIDAVEHASVAGQNGS